MTPASPNREDSLTRVFLITDNRLIRETLAKLLSRHGFNVTGSIPVSHNAIEEMCKASPEVVVMDGAAMRSPFNVAQQARRRIPGVKLLLIGMEADKKVFLHSVRAGVMGYVTQDRSTMDVVAAVREVSANLTVCPAEMTRFLFSYVAGEWKELPTIQIKAGLGLTRREQQLIPLIAQGLTNKEIATHLCLSEQTVKNHIHRMLRKLGSSDRLAVVEACRRERVPA